MTQIDPGRSIREFYAFHLKRHREAAGLSQPALAALVHVSPQLIGHLENGIRRPTPRLSRTLDAALGLNRFFESLFPRLVEESGIPVGFAEYTDEEARASLIKIYSQFIVAGLLQTQDYAREVLRRGVRADKLDEMAAARMARQELFQGENPPGVVAILDENAIRRRVGGGEVMKAQLESLLERNQEYDVTILVVPFEAQIFPEGSFTLLSFDAEPDVAYEEGASGQGHLIEAGPRVTRLRARFDLVASMALSAVDSENCIRGILEAT
ncbi:helix-turn-helix transcriptional regulator [Actinocorallia aurantiaca]|jgi:transcriptional regulator with XRE-family HTH domain|uniref:Helix-turn-helix transcriptional regulator n=1 Tax=Actinocorallia aurantiaca TaxID=46204 RepID=A0ABN3U9A4_9ACTN